MVLKSISICFHTYAGHVIGLRGADGIYQSGKCGRRVGGRSNGHAQADGCGHGWRTFILGDKKKQILSSVRNAAVFFCARLLPVGMFKTYRCCDCDAIGCGSVGIQLTVDTYNSVLAYCK